MLEPHLYVLSAHLPRHTQTHTRAQLCAHTKTYAGAHTHEPSLHFHTPSRTVHTHIHTFSHWIQMPTYFFSLHIFSLSLTSTHMHTFPPKLTPLCTRLPANMQVLQKKPAYLSAGGEERWELLISRLAFLSLSKYKKYILISPACIEIFRPWGITLYFKRPGVHCIQSTEANSRRSTNTNFFPRRLCNETVFVCI